MLRLAIFGCALLAFCAIGPEPAYAEGGFFSSLRQMFSRTRRPMRRVRPRPRPGAGLPVVTFAYAHHAGRYKRYRYSHQTPYAYYRHPYLKGFAYAARAAPRVRRRPTRNFNRRQRFRYSRDGRIIRLF